MSRWQDRNFCFKTVIITPLLNYQVFVNSFDLFMFLAVLIVLESCPQSSIRLHFSPMDASKRYQIYLERCETMSIHGRPLQNPVFKDVLWPWNKDIEQIDELLEVNISHVS